MPLASLSSIGSNFKRLMSLVGGTLKRDTVLILADSQARNMTTTKDKNLNGDNSHQDVIEACKANAARTAVDDNVDVSRLLVVTTL